MISWPVSAKLLVAPEGVSPFASTNISRAGVLQHVEQPILCEQTGPDVFPGEIRVEAICICHGGGQMNSANVLHGYSARSICKG